MKQYDFVFCTDDCYLNITLGCIWNLINKKSKEALYNIYLIGIHELHQDLLSKIKNFKNVNINIIPVDVELLNTFNGIRHVSSATYLKFFIPQLVNADQVLYLDGDIYVNKCVENLWNIVPQDFCVAAVWDPGYDFENQLLGLNEKEKAFNAGVLFLNNRKMRENNITERLIDYYLKHQNEIQNADQTVFNAVLKRKWFELDTIYNLQRAYYFKSSSELGITFQDKKNVIKNPILVHFTTHSKPWMFRCAHPYKKAYMDNYQALFGKYKEKDANLNGFIKKIYEKIQYVFWTKR